MLSMLTAAPHVEALGIAERGVERYRLQTAQDAGDTRATRQQNWNTVLQYRCNTVFH
jgi:hypothetical protein